MYRSSLQFKFKNYFLKNNSLTTNVNFKILLIIERISNDNFSLFEIPFVTYGVNRWKDSYKFQFLIIFFPPFKIKFFLGLLVYIKYERVHFEAVEKKLILMRIILIQY